MERTVRKILSMHFDAYSEQHRLPRYVRRAARQLQRCRTAAMGGHIEACPNGHFERIVYHSCHHRMCPQCNAVPREQWLLRMRDRLIDCAHHHLIFTLPHELQVLWRWNRRWFQNALFCSVAETLNELCADDRYLGAKPGFICALHTWGRSLNFHPHIHCLISDGGLDDAGQWQAPKKSCFLPTRVVMALFRGKLLARLRDAVRSAELQLPPERSAQLTQNLLNRLGRVKWNVHLRERYDHGHGVALYLARYLKGGALKNAQLCSLSEQHIGFRYFPHREPGEPARPMTLSLTPSAFLQRYLQHAPVPRAAQVRYYGLYASRRSAALQCARQQPHTLRTPALSGAPNLDRVQPLHGSTPQFEVHFHQCPQCAAVLTIRAPMPRQQAPPVVLH